MSEKEQTSIPISGFFSDACLGCKLAASPDCASFKSAVLAGHSVGSVQSYLDGQQKNRELVGCSSAENPSSQPVEP